MTKITDHPQTVAIVGAGPAGLMAADAAATAGAKVTIFDAMPSPGRKFLMAGRGGLNITHSEDFETFVTRYGQASAWLRPMLERFSPADTRAFCADLGVETFVGTSGRVFPTAMKASPLLRAWLARLAGRGVTLRARTKLVGLTADGALKIAGADGAVETVEADAVVLALGGASWPRLGSTGAWTQMLGAHDIAVTPLRPANCGIEIAWSEHFRRKFDGAALKTAKFAHGGREIRGEAVITRRGLEGGPVYALAAALDEDLRAGRAARLTIDLKPDLSVEVLAERLGRRRAGDSLSNTLRKATGLTPAAVALLRETPDGALPADPLALAGRVKSCGLAVRGVAGLERAISSSGGVVSEEFDAALMLRKAPGVFVAGEMLDWDAPTGGYLLQACLATGRRAGDAAGHWRRS